MKAKCKKARWIASYPKSGNTWIRFFVEAYLTNQLNINHIQTSYSDVHVADYQRVSDMPVTEINAADSIWYRNSALMNQIVRRSDGVIFKTHFANTAIHGIDVIPAPLTQCAIYIVRDPRAVCVSLARHNGKTIDEMIHQMNESRTYLSLNSGAIGHLAGTWTENVQSWATTDFSILRMRYEDLKDDPEHWLSEVVKMLGLKLRKRQLRRAIRMCDMEKLKAQEKRHGFRERLHQKQFFGGSGDWKEILSDTQVKQIELVHREYMTQLGYLENRHGSVHQIQHRGDNDPERRYGSGQAGGDADFGHSPGSDRSEHRRAN